MKRFFVVLLFVVGYFGGVGLAAETKTFKCTVTGRRTHSDGRVETKTHDYLQVNFPWANEARRWAVAQFRRDFDARDGWSVDRDSVVAVCNEVAYTGPNPMPPNRNTPLGGSWSCRIAMHWQGIAKNGALQKGWYSGDLTGVAGGSETQALAQAYSSAQMYWSTHDGAGIQRVIWSQIDGRCWDHTKPGRPIGWPKHIQW